jgi:catalase
MSDSQKEQLFHNIAATMEGIPQNIIDRQMAHFAKADPAYAEGVKRALAKHPEFEGVGRGEPDPKLEPVGAR